MNFIKKIEIQYFRSIYWETISDISNVNIFTGKNDAGKSNVLKALNLFFNNKTDANTDFDFSKDFNVKRLEEVRKETVKGKQFVQIKITFNRGKQYENTLPETFTVTKKWFRTDDYPSVVTDNVEQQLLKKGKKYSDRSKSSLTKFLKKITYLYIPAVKDDKTFIFALSMLQDCIYSEKLSDNVELNKSIDIIGEGISNTVIDINKEFKSVTGIETSVNPPHNLKDFYSKSLNIYTKYNENEIEIDRRGDGIRVRYIPSILNYIAMNSSKYYIWGFEEPENSLEYNLAIEMANSFYNQYSKKLTIFLTTHSPAFIALENKEMVSLYRCFNMFSEKYQGTKILNQKEFGKKLLDVPSIEEELGYYRIQQEVYEKYKQLLEKNALIEDEIDELQKSIKESQKPVIITEGKTDVLILKEAWKKLYDTQCPYEIKSCSTTDENVETTAGCDVLAKYLESYRYDTSNVVIGLFDRDSEGKRSYKLDNNYVETEDKRGKIHKNKKACALMIPTPVGKERFEELEVLCIEFLFEKSDLEKRVDGVGLKLKSGFIREMYNGKEISKKISTDFACSEIVRSSKMDFAEKVVPTLEKASFVHFKLLFETIESLLQQMK